MNGRARWGCLYVILILASFGTRLALAQDAPLPVEPYKKNDKGVIYIQVHFDKEGKVDESRIVRSNVPYPLEASTADYVKRKWVIEDLAGGTFTFPIVFDQLPWYAKQWNQGLITPPNLLPPGDPGRTLKLQITFDADGWISRVAIGQSTGLEDVDRNTAIWVKVHWHSDKYAGQTVDTPFEFKTPTDSKPTLAKKPTKTKPAPAPEPTDYAPPAMKVE